MFDRDYLTLHLVRLKPPEEWTNKGSGLSFVFVKGGVGRYVSGSLTRSLTSGDVLVLSGASGEKLCVADHGEMMFSWFSASLESLFPLFTSSEICLLQNVTDDFKNCRLYPASTPLAKECHKLLEDVPPQSDLGHRGQALRVAAAILSEEFKTAHSRRVGFVRPEQHMLQVFEKLSVTELLGLSVGELAAKFGCSRRHLNRLFHQHFGFSVAALRMEMRLLKAVSLLRDPDAKIINVAEECGFNHLGLFNTCFKRRFGASPGQYRKMRLPAAVHHVGLLPTDQACPLHANGLCPWTGGPAHVQATPKQPFLAQKTGPPRLLTRTRGSNGGMERQTVAIPQRHAADVERRKVVQANA